MDPSKRIVIQLPLTELFNSSGPVEGRQRRQLRTDDIKALLRGGPLVFVVANLGEPLKWIPPSNCYRFWKDHVRARLCPYDGVFSHELEGYPEGYCYWASEWSASDIEQPIVLLERIS